MGTALITGATSGIGLEMAWELAARGHRVILVARNAEKLAQTAQEIIQIANVPVETFTADLADAKERDSICARLAVKGPGTAQSADLTATTKDRELPPVDLLVNNAGCGLTADFTHSSYDDERAALELMVTAVMELTHAALPGMLERDRGAILNVASIAALTARGTYSAHKAWVRTFTESLAAQLHGTHVSATAVCPGITRTNFHQAQKLDTSNWPSWLFTDPQQVAKEALDAVARRKVLVTPGTLYKATSVAARLAPRSLVRALAGPKLAFLK